MSNPGPAREVVRSFRSLGSKHSKPWFKDHGWLTAKAIVTAWERQCSYGMAIDAVMNRFLFRAPASQVILPRIRLGIHSWHEFVFRRTFPSFRSQYPVHIPPRSGKGHYRVDFGDEHLRIAVELDGTSHAGDSLRYRDSRVDTYLLSQGWRVIRIEQPVIEACVIRNLMDLQDSRPFDGDLDRVDQETSARCDQIGEVINATALAGTGPTVLIAKTWVPIILPRPRQGGRIIREEVKGG